MDVLNLIDSELRNMHLSDFERVRYIYLRTCELFYFDMRYHFNKYISKRVLSKITRKEIDLTNVDDFRVICHTYSEYVLKKLINEFTNIDVIIHSGGHSFLTINDKNGCSWDLDATLGDLSRVKIGIKPNGFTCIESWSYNYYDYLAEIDETLGYKYKEKKDYLQSLDLGSFNDLINGINNLIKESELNNFADVLFFFKWLLNGCFCIYSDCTGMDNDYNFYNFILDEANKDLFCLSKDVDKYGISKISFDEGLQLSKKLHMNSRSIFNKNR